MENNLRALLARSEVAEFNLSYSDSKTSEVERKRNGSYFTPRDVAIHFWRSFFRLNKITSKSEAEQFISRHRFIEPSVGSGTLVLALFRVLIEYGVDLETIGSVELEMVDINARALDFVDNCLAKLDRDCSIGFCNLSFSHSDFLNYEIQPQGKPIVLFGNPPFVKNVNNTSPWKNSFADFLEVGLSSTGPSSHLHFILPLAIAFSRDYRKLRKYLLHRESSTIALSHYDNIPDTLFKSGKPRSENSNKANSQRCSILTVSPSDQQRVLSTKLHRWTTSERRSFLREALTYLDITDVAYESQIIRPENRSILRYLQSASTGVRLHDFTGANGEHRLHVGSVARNFIPIREAFSYGTHCLKFSSRRRFLIAFFILSSQLFFDYWRTVGDGFHVTKSNLLDFPISDELAGLAEDSLDNAEGRWMRRNEYVKVTKNSGRVVRSFDFTAASKDGTIDLETMYSLT